MKSCMIEVSIGDKVREIKTGKIGILKDVKLAPNSINSAELVAVLYVYMITPDKIISSTSDKWTVVDEENVDYKEFYPSVRQNELCREIEKADTIHRGSTISDLKMARDCYAAAAGVNMNDDPPSMTQSYFHD